MIRKLEKRTKLTYAFDKNVFAKENDVDSRPHPFPLTLAASN
jgi:beta-phosphoglucomutase-like phosphatase (HAD superfamily)